MIFCEQLAAAQRQHESLLCVGLDPEPARLPGAWKGQPDRIYDFCAAIVDATKDLVCAFKPQIAYFAAHRAEDQLERLMAHMRRVAPSVPVILDAKRGDIGSTAEQYAHEAFTRYQADAVTLSPFMGFDTMEPFLKYPGKGVILLCRTSNPGGSDLQNLRLADVDGQPAWRAEQVGIALDQPVKRLPGQPGNQLEHPQPPAIAALAEIGRDSTADQHGKVVAHRHRA